jgi:hypothetical protein
MKLHVAGRDRSEDLGHQVTGEARRLAARDDAPEFLDYPFSAVSLNSSGSGAEYLDRMLNLLTDKTGVSTEPFYIPRKPGPLGTLAAACKRLLWKVFRYQHDRVVFQQNMINLQLTAAIEFMHKEHSKETAALRERIAELEGR